MLAKGLKSLESIPKAVLSALLATLILGVGAVDYVAGTDTTFSAIYLLPIGIAAWFLGFVPACILAILSSIVWVAGDLEAGARYTSPLIPIWNVAVRFVMFL